MIVFNLIKHSSFTNWIKTVYTLFFFYSTDFLYNLSTFINQILITEDLDHLIDHVVHQVLYYSLQIHPFVFNKIIRKKSSHNFDNLFSNLSRFVLPSSFCNISCIIKIIINENPQNVTHFFFNN